MKNTIKLFVIIAFFAIIGFSLMACDLNEEETASFEGTWGSFYSSVGEFTFNNENFMFQLVTSGHRKGTFTKTESQITFNSTHEWVFNSSTLQYEWVPLTSPPTGAGVSDHVFLDSGNPVNYKFEHNDGKIKGITIDGKLYTKN
jgi:hypothetical protein